MGDETNPAGGDLSPYSLAGGRRTPDKPGALRRFMSWLGGSLLLYILGDPLREQVIDPLFSPLRDGGNEVVSFLLRPLSVLLIPVAVCIGVVVLAMRGAPRPARWPRRLRGVTAALVTVFLVATLASSYAGQPALTHLATVALVLIAVLLLEGNAWTRSGRRVGLAGTILALASLHYGVSQAKAGSGAFELLADPGAATLDLAGFFGLGIVLCTFGLAVLVDSRRLLTTALLGACLPMALWSGIAFLARGVPWASAAYGLGAIALAAAALALRRSTTQAPGTAGVIGRISGRTGTCAALIAGFAAMALAVAPIVDGHGLYLSYRVLLAGTSALLALSFWCCAAAQVAGRVVLTGLAGLLTGASFVWSATWSAMAGISGIGDPDYAIDRYNDWTLAASSQALLAAAFLVAGGGILLRRFDREERLIGLIARALDRFMR
ncbi:hypothetical protein [Myceligenerans crystallogenes]|uniref:Uncharacterized protein n=1 Tax=Myceligenerans crystallogenes TaxID=316335 RepID=A0ABN2N8J0_9MICO